MRTRRRIRVLGIAQAPFAAHQRFAHRAARRLRRRACALRCRCAHAAAARPGEAEIGFDHARIGAELGRACPPARFRRSPAHSRSPRPAARRARSARRAGSRRRPRAARRWRGTSPRTISGASPRLGSSSISSFGLRHQRAAERQHLPLAARERAGELRRAAPSAREARVDRLEVGLEPRAARAQRWNAPSTQVVLDRELAEQLAPLGHQAQAALRRAPRPIARRDRRRGSAPRRCSGSRPITAPSSVDLPAPFGPITVTIAPSSTCRLARCRPSTLP